MNTTDINFEKVKTEAEAVYAAIEHVVCPYFGDGEPVAFNSRGIKHINFKKDRVARSRSDQFMRLKNIHLVKRILEKSRTLQEYEERQEFIEIKSNKRAERVLKTVKYFGFIAIINDSGRVKRLKIIVRQEDGGAKHFWSIIPFWTSNKQLKIHSGNLE
jgi:hypothetical protein